MSKLIKTNTATENLELVRACKTTEEITELLNTATVKMLQEFNEILNAGAKKKDKKSVIVEKIVSNFFANSKPEIEKFEVGATYSNLDENSPYEYLVVARTDNAVTFKNNDDEFLLGSVEVLNDTAEVAYFREAKPTFDKVMKISSLMQTAPATEFSPDALIKLLREARDYVGELKERSRKHDDEDEVDIHDILEAEKMAEQLCDSYFQKIDAFESIDKRDEVFTTWHISENDYHGEIDFEIKELPEIKTVDEALIKIKASATHSELYSVIASCQLSVQTELFRHCWPQFEDSYTNPGLFERPFKDKVSALTSFMKFFDDVIDAYLLDKYKTPQVFELLENFINGEIKEIYSSCSRQEQEELTKIRRIMADIEDKTYFKQIKVLEKCSKPFLWDMCRAYGIDPTDDKITMIVLILNCTKTTEEKIQILKQILPDVRVAFNCWTDEGKLSVNEAYEQSLNRLEAWLRFFLRKEKKS